MPPRLVLMRPRNADNLGAIARAMKNFGLSDWVVVSPNPQLLEGPGLHRLAVKSGDLLESVRRVESLAEAVGDCSWVVGTTMRRIERRHRLTPSELMAEVQTRPPENWALVFGDERHGLSNEDLAQCHGLSFIPASEEQPSLNLAQAVLLYAYEFAASQRGVVKPVLPLSSTDEQLRQLKVSFEMVLQQSSFIHEVTQTRVGIDDAFGALVRAKLTRRESEVWNAMFRVIAKRLTTGQT
jgi:tRNA (cytidine32/uridine32-2'-O)-methyltransferase